MNWKRRREYIILILGVGISAGMVLGFPDLYHLADIPSFLEWAGFWDAGWRDIYVRCAACNYPIVGMFSSAGVISILGLTQAQHAALIFRLWLALIDGANVVLIFFLLKRLSVRDPALSAGVIGLLISSWAGGALWGQIDTLSQFFLLLTLLWMADCLLAPKRNFLLFTVVSSLLMALLILTKQLIVFSFFSLELLFLTAVFLRRRVLPALGYSILHLGALMLFLFMPDRFLQPVDGYASHLQLIWSERSAHGGILSANGLNLWVLLPQPMSSLSAFPFAFLRNSPLENIITPVHIGWFFFLSLAGLLVLSTLLEVRHRAAQGEGGVDREMLFQFLWLLAVINLCFNVALTGTHERYLYHFYPFIFIALLGWREYNSRIRKFPMSLLMLGSTLYGIFVLGVLWGMFAFRNIFVHQILAVFHAILLGILVAVTLKSQHFPANLRLFFGRMCRWRPSLRRG